MRIALVAVAIAALMSAASADEPYYTRAPRPPAPPRHVVLTGMVESLAVSQQEPSAEPQAGFYLRTSDDGAAAVLVVMPAARFACPEGAQATLEGDFLPADPPFPPALFAAKLLACGAGEPRP